MVFIFQFQHVLCVMALRYAIHAINFEKYIRQSAKKQAEDVHIFPVPFLWGCWYGKQMVEISIKS